MLDTSKAQILRAIEEIQNAEDSEDMQESVSSVCMDLGVFLDSERVAKLEGKPADLFAELCIRRIREAQEMALRRIFNRNKSLPEYSEHADGMQSAETIEEDQHLTKSKDITQTLRRIHQMAQNEVLRSELNIEELDVGSSSLVALQQRYSVVDVLLNGSRQLVKLLDEADAWDRRKMQLALGFLAACVVWVLWQRVIGPPIRFLLWTFLKVIGVVKYGTNWTTSTPQDVLRVTQSDVLLSAKTGEIDDPVSNTLALTSSIISETSTGIIEHVEL